MLVIFSFTLASTRVLRDSVRDSAGELSLREAIRNEFRSYIYLSRFRRSDVLVMSSDQTADRKIQNACLDSKNK